MNFAKALEQVCVQTVESGKMTKDLAICIHGSSAGRDTYLNTNEFLEELDQNLKSELAK